MVSPHPPTPRARRLSRAPRSQAKGPPLSQHRFSHPAQVNSNDNDNGVLEGKWNVEFANHENPSRWDGSVAILRKWAQNNYSSVKYGQCWVFAGVAGTGTRGPRRGCPGAECQQPQSLP